MTRTTLSRAALGAAMLVCSLVPALAGQPAHATSRGTGFTFGDWNVRTQEFDYNFDTGAFSAPSHITLTRVGSEISADRASGNQKQRVATLYGHVVMHDSSGIIGGFAAPGKNGARVPATLTCDQLQVDGNAKVYVAVGHVHFVQGSSQAYADRAVLNGVTHQLELHGNVHLVQ